MAKSSKGLGKGLGALLGKPQTPIAAPTPDPEKGERVEPVSLDQIVPSPMQPRKQFDEEALRELIESIKERGIIQPLIVRPVDGKYELIAGERRWRAAQRAGLAEAPVIVRDAADQEVLELALIENLQRADLDPVEEAEGYDQLVKQFKMTQEEVAQKVGKNRTSVANAIRLLALPEELRAWLRKGMISVGHAKVVLGLANSSEMQLVAEKIVRENLTVRQTEKLVVDFHTKQPRRPRKAGSGKSGTSSASSSGKGEGSAVSNATWADIERRLQQSLGTRVRISGSEDSGKIEVSFFSADDLDRLIKMMGYTNG